MFALGGRVSVECSRCPGSMAWHARDSVAPLRRSSAGWMPARIGRLSVGVGCRHPVTNSQGGVDEVGMSTATPYRQAVLCG